MKKQSTVDFHLRVPKKIHEALARAAEKNRRPVTSEILVRLEATLVSP